MIRQFPLGQPMTVQFWRDGQTSELQVVLQPAREQYEVAFRGDESIGGASRSGGDLETRVMRLEQQLAMVLQELRQLRQSQPGSGQATIGGAGVGETTAFGATTETTGTATETTGAATTQSGAAGAAATTQPDPFGEATTPADAQPAATPPTTPAPGTEPAASDDAFGTSTTESPTDASTEAAPADAAPAEGEAAPAETPAGTESDDLFE
jgi:hypothetical protein